MIMKVGVDISQLAHEGGVASYTQNLAEQLLGSKELEVLFFYSSLRKPYRGNLKHVKQFKLPPTLFEVLFNRIRNTPIERFIGPVDIFHSSDWIQPPSKAKKVTTYHDVIPLKFPQWSHPKIVAVHKRRLEIVKKEVDLIIAVSETTKKDLMEVSGIPENKIKVVYEGVSKKFIPYDRKEVEKFRIKYKLPEKFILAIGGIGERRNLKRVKQALGSKYKLIITGQNIPRLADEEMPLLYNAASMLVYPSFYEGFGLPILEAMACGIPVVTSNISSMPEVGGKAVIYVNPESTDDIKKAIEKVDSDKDLKKEMIENGYEQVKLFTWERVGDETVKLYKEMVT